MTETKKRIEWVDVAKGLLIILVIVGHSHISPAIDNTINSFHMAAFFILTGYTLNIKRELKYIIVKLLGGVITQYLMFSLLLLLYDLLKAMFFSSGDFNLSSGLVSVIIPISGREATSVYGLWFLPTLCLAKIIAYIILKYRKWSIITVLLTIIISISLTLFTGVVSIISLLPISAFFIIFGSVIKPYLKTFLDHWLLSLIISFLLFIMTAFLNDYFSEISFDFSSFNLGVIPLYLLSSITGSCFIIIVSSRLEKLSVVKSIGKDSLYYYGLHYEVMGLVGKLCSNSVCVSVITLVCLIPVVSVYKNVYSLFRCDNRSD